MVANYIRITASDEQDAITKIDDFLVNHVGWYREDTIADSASDKDYVWVSDGEPERADNPNPRYIRIRGWSNSIRAYAYATYIDSGTYTEEIFNSTYTLLPNQTSNIVLLVIADKERVVISSDVTAGRYQALYVGRLNPIFTAAVDPYPNMCRGNQSTFSQWGGTNAADLAYAYSPQGTLRTYRISDFQTLADSGAPNPRNGQYTAINPLVYSLQSSSDYDVRGYARGVYQVSNSVINASYITLASGTHMIFRPGYTTSSLNFAFGPLTDQRVGDINRIPPNTASVDYSFRGFVTDINTLANWRLDSDTTGSYVDETGNYDLTPVNSPTLSNSPLVQSVDFNGSTQRASVSGTAATATALTGEWTCEIVFNPDTIPSSGKHTLLEFGTDSDGTESENTLLSISVTTTSGVNVFWERDAAGTDESNSTSSTFLDAGRWHYLAVTKKDVGASNYDIEVWHAGFEDHVPVLRETFSSVSNSTGGSASTWFMATDAPLASYYDGQIDAVRVQKEHMTEAEITSSFRKVRL
jgi:hypothetical protein